MDEQSAIQLVEQVREVTYALHTANLIAYAALLKDTGASNGPTFQVVRDEVEKYLGIDALVKIRTQ